MMKGQKYSRTEALELVEECYENEEPIFIIRGRDKVSAKAIKAYAELVKSAVGASKHGTPTYDLAEDAERFAAEVLRWQAFNMEKLKMPD